MKFPLTVKITEKEHNAIQDMIDCAASHMDASEDISLNRSLTKAQSFMKKVRDTSNKKRKKNPDGVLTGQLRFSGIDPR